MCVNTLGAAGSPPAHRWVRKHTNVPSFSMSQPIKGGADVYVAILWILWQNFSHVRFDVAVPIAGDPVRNLFCALFALYVSVYIQ